MRTSPLSPLHTSRCEQVLGGELYAVLHMLGRLEEGQARFYAACVADVLGHLHDVCGIVCAATSPIHLPDTSEDTSRAGVRHRVPRPQAGELARR